ncbi:unnamed protein product [Calypogeia fissa]
MGNVCLGFVEVSLDNGGCQDHERELVDGKLKTY